MWLEVKNWNAPVIPPHKRPAVIADYLDKTKTTSSFWDEITGKFEGTRACLKQLNELPPKAELGLLLEAPQGALRTLAPMMSLLEAKLAASSHFKGRVIKVFGTGRMSSVHPNANASHCQVEGSPKHVCVKPVNRCSVSRQAHSGT